MSFGISSSVYPTASFAAIFAMGNPVAFDASADDRDTRGFISMTTIRPFSGLMANWMFDPPVSTPTLLMMRRAASRIRWYSLSLSVRIGATVMLSPVCTPIGSTFSIEQMTTKLSATSRITSSSNSFQPMTDSSTKISWTGENSRPRAASSRNSSTLYAMPPPTPPIVNDGRMIAGNPVSSTSAIASSSDLATPLRGNQLDVEFLQNATLGKRNGEIERGLAANSGQHRVRPFLFDDGGDQIRRERLDIGAISHLGIRHDRRR